ncbi:hypothetical protein GIB67_010708 [Kingdonia uniflora]|uniref:Alcohol dehydrogenase-like N-terminal domain-containing protein n=1 Tax=Kingdonia uniflora TaxID=39325 RepID=A0A7J7L8S6_9MAGN|nr:hypothetical protein GIB67_010708 [Kingdonia uniflora]
MELKPGLSALVTGGSSGIGKAISLALGEKGIFVTVVDLSEEKGKEVASLVEKENAKFHTDLKYPSALFIRCDVSNTSLDFNQLLLSGDISAAFEKHLDTYGGLDICIISAGISSGAPLHEDKTDAWRHTVNVNLIAVIDCTRVAIQTMLSGRKPGVIINMGSASGLYPMYGDPVYSGSKGGVILFTRSLVPYKRRGIRVNVLCPEFSCGVNNLSIILRGTERPVDSWSMYNFTSSSGVEAVDENFNLMFVQTAMGLKVDPKFVDITGGFVPMEMVVKGTFELIQDESKAGSCLWITKRRGMEYWPTPIEEAKYLVKSSKLKSTPLYKAQSIQIPQSYEKMVVYDIFFFLRVSRVVHTLSHNFRNATNIVRAQLRLPIEPDHVLVKIIYAGVNASDVNFSSGRYFGGSDKELASRLPFDAGFEAVGLVVSVGNSVIDLKIGTPVAIMTFGSYAEFQLVPSKYILPVPRPDPEVVAMLTSGLTASVALEKAAQMESGKVVLVTAAAGGTGQFAVQLTVFLQYISSNLIIP